MTHRNNYHSRTNVRIRTYTPAFASAACVGLFAHHHSSLSANTKSFACSEQQSILLKMRTRKNGTSVTVIFLFQPFLSFPLLLEHFFPSAKVLLMTQRLAGSHIATRWWAVISVMGMGWKFMVSTVYSKVTCWHPTDLQGCHRNYNLHWRWTVGIQLLCFFKVTVKGSLSVLTNMEQ